MTLKNGNKKHELTKADMSKGGKNSQKKQAENKSIARILHAFMNDEARHNVQFMQIAQKLGLKGTESIKEVFTIVALLNGLKTANLKDLEVLAKLLGEESESKQDNGILNELAEYLKNGK